MNIYKFKSLLLIVFLWTFPLFIVIDIDMYLTSNDSLYLYIVEALSALVCSWPNWLTIFSIVLLGNYQQNFRQYPQSNHKNGELKYLTDYLFHHVLYICIHALFSIVILSKEDFCGSKKVASDLGLGGGSAWYFSFPNHSQLASHVLTKFLLKIDRNQNCKFHLRKLWSWYLITNCLYSRLDCWWNKDLFHSVLPKKS